MKQYLNLQFLQSQLYLLWEKLSQTIFSLDTYMECGAIVLSLLLAYVIDFLSYFPL